jgi:hypothetical protein
MTAKKKDPLKPPYHYDFKEAKKNLIAEEEQFVYTAARNATTIRQCRDRSSQ